MTTRISTNKTGKLSSLLHQDTIRAGLISGQLSSGTAVQCERNNSFIISETAQIAERSEVKEFLERAREFIPQKRAITGGELGIPDMMVLQ